jgi:hypothetical protein
MRPLQLAMLVQDRKKGKINATHARVEGGSRKPESGHLAKPREHHDVCKQKNCSRAKKFQSTVQICEFLPT